jgi:hypothetical protein
VIDKKRLRELLEEATIDCYSEEEEFTGVLVALQDNLTFPLRAALAGAPVVMEGLDDQRSSLRRGIVAQVKRDGRTYYVSLADLEPVDLDPASAGWLEMYRWWVGTA